MISEQRPLFFFGLGGALLIIIGMVAGIYALRLYSGSGAVSIGWSLLAFFFIILGAISFFMGLVLRALSSVVRDAVSRNKR